GRPRGQYQRPAGPDHAAHRSGRPYRFSDPARGRPPAQRTARDRAAGTALPPVERTVGFGAPRSRPAARPPEREGHPRNARPRPSPPLSRVPSPSSPLGAAFGPRPFYMNRKQQTPR